MSMTVHPFFQRLTLLTGPEAAGALEKCRVIVFGLGGVGSWCAEALVRSGVGTMAVVDFDMVCDSNINRQVQATSRTLGRPKAAAMEERLKEINPLCSITSHAGAFTKETPGLFDIPGADYVIDAIDTLEDKLDLIEAVTAAGRCLFSSMGMAQKLDPTLIRTADIWKTSGCPLARFVRLGLRKRNFHGHFTAVYSPEQPVRQEPSQMGDTGRCEDRSGAGREGGKKAALGSAVTVTAAAGMALASLVIRDACARYAPPGRG
ncbi:MAG: tRNA threonylcarbamoyladenosine dehydratase [Treponema sp.]|nr:tRNA threonylcarbamoyladenosine dehydratase [Treponema sp.]